MAWTRAPNTSEREVVLCLFGFGGRMSKCACLYGPWFGWDTSVPLPLFKLCKCRVHWASATALSRRALLQHFLSIREERVLRVAYSITPSVF